MGWLLPMSKKKILRGLGEQISNTRCEIGEIQTSQVRGPADKSVALMPVRRRLDRLIEIREELEDLLI